VDITAHQLAERFTGVREVPGEDDNPFIMSMLTLDAGWPEHDEVPWCSAFVNYVAWLLRLPRSKSLRARSWLEVGRPVSLNEAQVGFDVIVLARGKKPWPGPDVIKAPGHVGFFAGWHMVPGSGDAGSVHVLGGNQGNTVSTRTYELMDDRVDLRLLGIRRLR
jgi:uncharacterized protein (TIGR02594 family)